MQRRQCLRWGWGLLGAAVSGRILAQASATPAAEKLVWRERMLLGFGTSLWLKAGHANADQLEAALSAAVAAIRSVERQMSLFDPDSALSRLNAQGFLSQPDTQLLSVLKLSRTVSSQSGGAFDVSMQPLWQVWSQTAAEARMPSRREVQRARQRVNWRAVEATPSMLRLNQQGMGLSLNGIAQGYAADCARAALQSHGILHALIDTGETTSLGHAPDDKAWSFDIENAVSTLPDATPSQAPLLLCDGRAMATSSDAHTVFSADHLHHHILNPDTGYSPTHWSSVTVIASSCVLADALTKVFFMLPPSEVLSAARRWQVDVVLQNKAGQWFASQHANIQA